MAREVFADLNHIVTENYRFADEGESRYLAIGMTRKLMLVVVVFVGRRIQVAKQIQPGFAFPHLLGPFDRRFAVSVLVPPSHGCRLQGLREIRCGYPSLLGSKR